MVGIEGAVPILVTDMAAAALAMMTASSTFLPLDRAKAKAL